jgi:hypothetical protein
MEVQNLNIVLPAGYTGNPVELIIRESTEAPQLNEKVKFSALKVALTSIAIFLSKKNIPSPIEANPGLITYSLNPDFPFLQYNEDPNDELATELKAVLEIDPDFKLFGINTDQQFNQKAFERLIRKTAHCFGSPEVAKDLIQRLNNFEARFDQVVQKEDDRQGQKKDSIESAIRLTKGEIPKSLHLNCPIFKNTKPVSFEVEIEVDKGPGNLPVFSFYSVELEIMKRTLINELILAEVQKLEDRFALVEV